MDNVVDREKISLVTVNNQKSLETYIKNGIDSIGGLQLKPENTVIIKPNLCCIKSPETGATTDVRVVEAIITYLQKNYNVFDIYLVESDGSQVLADMAFKLLGYEKLAEKLGVKLLNLSSAPYFVKDCPNNIFLKKIKIPKIFQEDIFFISVPKMKTHIDCLVTCALKNQFGCNPNPRKFQYHKNLNDAIVDLNTVFKPDLVIVDGLVAMEGFRGPTDGLPVVMNLLIFGTDCVAVDHLVTRVMGLDPKKVSYFQKALQRGLGNTDYVIIGSKIKNNSNKFKIIRPNLSNFYGLFCKY